MLTIDDVRKDYHTVVVAAPDLQGRLFGRRMPARQFLADPQATIDICTCALAWDITQNLELDLAWAGWHTGWNDFKIKPDLKTLRPYPGVGETAICLADCLDEDDRPVELAPRTILRRQLERTAVAGYSAQIASELEFYLYRQDQRTARLNRFQQLDPTTIVRSDYSIVDQAPQEPFLGKIRRAMDSAGIPVYACQAEYGFGQWELNLEHCDPLEMADRHVIYKAGVKEMALSDGLTVTFMARPVANDIGSSCHIHVSLWDGDKNVFATGARSTEISEKGKSFIGGLLEHIDETALFYAPYVNSYKRHIPDDAGGGIKAWGYNNRTVACRVLGTGDSTRVEIRYAGADVNPYLAFAAILASGMDGLQQGLDAGNPFEGSAYKRPELPRTSSSLGQAVSIFEASDFVCRTFGELTRAHYAGLARAEWKEYLKAVTDWELIRGFELV